MNWNVKGNKGELKKRDGQYYVVYKDKTFEIEHKDVMQWLKKIEAYASCGIVLSSF